MGYLEDRAGLAGKVGIVVGGGGGLGRACATDLGRAGVRLALCDRNPDLLDETVATLRADGAEVLARAFDAREPELLAGFFESADEFLGQRLDVLVNVVGGTPQMAFADSTPRIWDAVIRTNFTWLVQSCHLAIPPMRRSGGGSIVNLTSIEGHRAAPGFAVYAGMKAAVTNFGRTLAVELGPDRIRVNTIAPDMVPTEGILAFQAARGEAPDPGLADAGLRIAVPMADRGSYEDIGGCALFLASDLSRFVTGTSLHADGGTYASSGWFNWPGTGFSPVPPAPAVAATQAAPPGA
jgi:NAD(P)-dependent dehydrogenase (short-subunit alcohol dehydrogenase family)